MTSRDELKAVLARFADVRVTVVGDIMLDRFWWGTVERISPEAPVPVVSLGRTSEVAGGAANVAANVAGLGATVNIVGMVGADPEGDSLRNLLAEAGIGTDGLLTTEGHPTTVKTRIIAHGQQVVRVDQEKRIPANIALIGDVEKWISGTDVLIISDYAKGFLTNEMLSRLITAASDANVPVLVDPKGKEYSKYRGATIITPNRREALEACQLDDPGDESSDDVVRRAGLMLLEAVSCDAVLITLGERGMALFCGTARSNFPALARKVYDVTGAGDTVIGTLAAAVGAGAGFVAAAELANIAAGLVVEQVGTTAIDREHLASALAESIKA